MLRKLFHIVVVVTIPFISLIYCDLYSSVADLNKVFLFESDLIYNIRQCFNENSTKFNSIKPLVNIYENIHNTIKINGTNEFSNPINAFLFLKRLQAWQNIQQAIIAEGCTNAFIQSEYVMDIFPNSADISGAIGALIRLQEMYGLNTTDLANGNINGMYSYASMNAYDCFDVAYHYYDNSDFYSAIPWFLESVNRLEDWRDTEHHSLLLERALGYLANCYYRQNQLKLALQMTKKLLKLTPNDTIANENYKNILHVLRKQEIDGSDTPFEHLDSYEIAERNHITENGDVDMVAYEKKEYRKLCRRQIQPSTTLQCRYISNSPFSRIGPFKMEMVHHDPDIVIYHNVLYDNEIDILKQLALPTLFRSGIKKVNSEDPVILDVRTSKIVFLPEHWHPALNVISKRIEDMTGLSLSTAEELQIGNYGIGGHYVPHWDYFGSLDTSDSVTIDGDRIATVLFYMSDVEQGGATVFPYIDLTLYPAKGSAAFWYNLHRSGEGDIRTRHAACPVLIGSKWVSNKWIQLKGQMFKRQCLMESDTIPYEELVNDIV